MRLCLVEDLAATGLEPLTLTRPVHELWLGCSTLGCKIAKAFGVGPGPQRRGGVIRSHLVPVQRQRDPHLVVNDRDWLARGPVIVANSRWVPPTGFEPPDFHGPSIGLSDGQPAFALVGREDAISLDPHGIHSWFEKIAERYKGSEVGGEWMHWPWNLLARNGEHIEDQAALLGASQAVVGRVEIADQGACKGFPQDADDDLLAAMAIDEEQGPRRGSREHQAQTPWPLMRQPVSEAIRYPYKRTLCGGPETADS